MEEVRKNKLKEKAKIALGFAAGVLAGAYIYTKGRSDQLEADGNALDALGKAGAIKVEIPEITETTTWKNIYD